jgi:hypothetical protein
MGILDWLKPKPRPDAETLALIEHTVATVDPLLKSVGSHERILAPSVRGAFDYCERVALAIPGPFPITRTAFATDPLVHALFGSADDIAAMFANSRCVREHLLEMTPGSGSQCCALLGMRHRESVGFGVRITGEIIRADEPQRTLYFTDHTLAEPAPDVDAAQRRLARAMFDGLLKGFVAHVEDVRMRRRQLREEQALARVRAAGAANTRRQAELQERLVATADALQPPRLIETLAGYLAAPEASLRLTPIKLSVDRSGIIATAREDYERADTLRFVELSTRDQRRWVVMIVRIDRDEARAAVERIDEARRHIVI